MSTDLTVGTEVESRSDNADQQVVLVYDAPSSFEPGRMTLQNTIASGNCTVLGNDGSTVRLRIEADDPNEAAQNGIHGEVTATFCE